MHIAILTIFPEFFTSFLSTSLTKKSIDRGLVSFELVNIRDFASPPHNKVDDEPYGGGAGMVMKPEPLFDATQHVKEKYPHAPVLLLSPRGQTFSQRRAQSLSNEAAIILVCGRYEGIDERYIESCVDEEISLGDFIIMGGEVGALAISEAVIRLLPDVLGNQDSILHESFSSEENLLEAPQYTRPAEFNGLKVPEVLLSGDHEKISAWRADKSISLTRERRPDLQSTVPSSPSPEKKK